MLIARLNDATAGRLISAGTLGLFILSEILHRRYAERVEFKRRLTHVGAGLIVMTFRWVLSGPWTVAQTHLTGRRLVPTLMAGAVAWAVV
jgi:hypothetical protein